MNLAARILDFLAGLAAPGGCEPSAFASPAAGEGRPEIGEAAATSVEPWPGRTARYDAQGKPIDSARASFGQYFATALSLGYSEVRAFLLGLTQAQDPEVALVSQYFRLSRGLARVLHELALRGGLSEAAYAAAWRRFFGEADNVPPDGGDLSYSPAVPANWNPVPKKLGSALDQAIARIVALESATPSGPTWTFTAPAPLLGEGWYVSGSNTLSRALASAAAGPAAADADGVYDGTPNHLGSTSGAVYHMRLEPGSSPVPGQLVYTSYTTAGLFTLVEPAGGSGNYNAVRGKVEDVTGYDPLDPTGSPVLAVWRPTVQVGPV